MTMPMYVSPEQLMKDRADFARKGIARGRSVVVASYDQGIAFVADNPSRTLHKVSEIYDRIGFAAVGKYNEFENLRVAGIRYADLRGFSYDRSDVTARGLANAYAQTLGTIFTTEHKPYEVEIAVAQVGASVDLDQIYRLTYDGSVSEERGFVAMGGAGEEVMAALRDQWSAEVSLGHLLRLVVDLMNPDAQGATSRLGPEGLEVAVLDRRRPRRTFRRVGRPLLDDLIARDSGVEDVPASDDARPGSHDTLTGRPDPAVAPVEDGTHHSEGHEVTNPQTQRDNPHPPDGSATERTGPDEA